MGNTEGSGSLGRSDMLARDGYPKGWGKWGGSKRLREMDIQRDVGDWGGLRRTMQAGYSEGSGDLGKVKSDNKRKHKGWIGQVNSRQRAVAEKKVGEEALGV